MKKLLAYFGLLRLFRLMVLVLLAGVLLLANTACDRPDARGARPVNPPVQAGGANNPHKGGGDGYTEYQMSTDPGVMKPGSKTQLNQANLPFSGDQWLAATTNLENNQSKLLYPGSEKISSPERVSELRQKAEQISEQPQPVLIQTDPEAKLLEKTQQAIEDASKFLQDVADSTAERPELQVNPAMGK